MGFNAFGLPFSYVLKDGLKPQTPQSRNSNFQAFLEVCRDMSLFMDDLPSLNFPVFSPSYFTSWGDVPQINDHLPWITLYFETNKR